MAQAAAARSGMIFDDDGDEREPFAAYLTDDASQSAAQAVATQRGWSTSNIRKGGLAAALRLLGVAPPARFMIVDIEGLPIEEVESGLTELARLGSSVMVLGTVNDVNYFRRIMRTGARDYLIKPVDADMLGEIFVRLEQPGDGVTPKGRVVGMIGARGGVGVTTLAINTAFIMAEKLVAPHRARRHGHLCRQHRARARHRADPRPARGASTTPSGSTRPSCRTRWRSSARACTCWRPRKPSTTRCG